MTTFEAEQNRSRSIGGTLYGTARSALAGATLVLVALAACRGGGEAEIEPEPQAESLEAVPGPPSTAAPARERALLVVQVSGVIDPPTARLVTRTIEEAERERATAVVLRVDSPGAVDVDVVDLVRRVETASVPVGAWVGGSGATARGAAALLVLAADVAGVAEGARVGPAVPTLLSRGSPADDERAEVARLLRGLAAHGGRSEDVAEDLTLHGRELAAGELADRGATELVAETLGAFIVMLDGRAVTVGGEEDGEQVVLSTARWVEGDPPRREPNRDVRFRRYRLGEQLVHTLTSPLVAYFLFVAGLALLVFEFYAVGVGIAGAVGALALVAAFVGLSHLPVSALGMALVVVAVLALSIDLQAGGLGFWTVVGVVALVTGSLRFYGGSTRLDPPLWAVALVIVGALALLLPGLTAVMRARFATPTIGRESLVGEMGTAREACAPEGVVVVRGAPWRARAARAALIEAGDRVRVTGIDGLTLRVEPATEADSEATTP